jgi:hypothetical protein
LFLKETTNGSLVQDVIEKEEKDENEGKKEEKRIGFDFKKVLQKKYYFFESLYLVHY